MILSKFYLELMAFLDAAISDPKHKKIDLRLADGSVGTFEVREESSKHIMIARNSCVPGCDDVHWIRRFDSNIVRPPYLD